MTLETAKKSVDFALSHSHDEFQLSFFGGEPLLMWDLMQKATAYAREKCSEKSIPPVFTVTTNGVLLDEEKCKWLKDQEFHIAVSIDGNDRMHDCCRTYPDGSSSHDDSVRGAKIVQAYYEKFELVSVVTPENVNYLYEGVEYLIKEGFTDITLNPDFYSEWNEAQLDNWTEQFKLIGNLYIDCFRNNSPVRISFIDSKIITHLKNGYEQCDKCRFGLDEMAVAPSGNIYPCERLVGNDTGEHIIGDIYNGFDVQRMVEIKNGNGFASNEECLECELAPRCMNWCHCVNIALTGDMNTTDGIVCFHEKMTIEIADYVGGVLFSEKNPAFMARFYGLR